MNASRMDPRRRLGDTVSVLLAVLALPVVFISLLSDLPPGESQPVVHLALRGVLVGCYLAFITFTSALLIGDKTWRWALLLWAPGGALITVMLIRILLSSVRDAHYLLLASSLLVCSLSGAFGSVALANRIRQSRLRWPYAVLFLVILGTIGFLVVKRLA